MRTISLNLVRSGEDESVLTGGVEYHAVVDSSRHESFRMPVSQRKVLDRLDELRYNPVFTKQTRAAALEDLAAKTTEILSPLVGPDLPTDGTPVQIDLFMGAHELWLLPFEAALADDGGPLFARREPAVVLTRRLPHAFEAHRIEWPARPRVLFVHASPPWLKAPAVPAPAHKEALLEALQPWVEPIPGLPAVIGREESVLTTLGDASLPDLQRALQAAEAEGRPYTHVHILAHGVPIPRQGYSVDDPFGIALEDVAERETETSRLVQVFMREGITKPLVVTLAVCDSGNVTNSLIASGGLAQELHRAGIPVVVASQLPLTFAGSVVLARAFYGAWMDGCDVREALHRTRVALYEARGERHDWVSMVSYVRLPEGYGDFLYEVRLVNQLAALETTSKHVQHLLDNDIRVPAQYDQVANRLQHHIRRLQRFLGEMAAVTSRSRREVEQENAGLLGSAYKRLAELLLWRASAEEERRDDWLAQSRAMLEKARDAYHSGFQRDPADHWVGVQYLVLDTILGSRISSTLEWYACYIAALAKRDHGSPKERIWALGSLCELNLLAPLLDVPLALEGFESDAVQALTDLCRGVAESPADLFPDPTPPVSTRRQLMRYETWWTPANGFLDRRGTDVVARVQELVRLIDTHGAP